MLILFLRQLAVSECVEMFHALAKQLFPQPSSRASHFSRLRHLLRSWYRDGCHDANTLEACLKENLGSTSHLFGHIHSLIATKVGVTAATIDKAFPVLLTNYNGSGKRDENCGKQRNLLSLEDVLNKGEAISSSGLKRLNWNHASGKRKCLLTHGPRWLMFQGASDFGRTSVGAFRCFLRRPWLTLGSLFPSAYTSATGPVQDGGMSGHNNPIKLALWENLRINPSLSKPDVVVSVGTGTRKSSISPRLTSFRHVLFDGCIPRLWRAYMSSFDGESNFRDVVNNLDEESRDDYKRLNVLLPTSEPAIDDTSRMSEMQDSVRLNPQLIDICQKTVYALLMASFYFELDGLPRNLPGARFQCSGMIRCRLPGEAMVELLQRVHPSRLTFVANTRILGHYGGKHDLCSLCRRYRKQIEFSVRDLGQSMSIRVQSQKETQRKIGCFPQTMQWFIDQQGLNAPFGTAYHKDLQGGSCKMCRANGSCPKLKRQVTDRGRKDSPRKKPRSF